MPKNLSRLVLRAACGFVLGLVLWGGFSAPYTRALGALTEEAIRLFEHPASTRLTANRTLLIVDRSYGTESPAARRFAIETTDITFNIILLITLFAASAHPFADRNVAGFAAAAAALVFVHVAAVASFVEAYYTATSMHHGYLAQHLWSAAPYFYSIVGVYGSAIALWWLLRPSATATIPESPRPAHRRQKPRLTFRASR